MQIRELSPEARNKLLKKIYTEIIRGYSILPWNNSFVYIKHINHFDVFDTDEFYEKKYNYAQSKGLVTEKERLADLKEMGKWGADEETKLKDLESYLDGLVKSRKHFITNEDKLFNKNEIDKTQLEISKLTSEKFMLIGRTCESYATQKQNEYYLMNILYKDKNFTELYYNVTDFDELEGYEINITNSVSSSRHFYSGQ